VQASLGVGSVARPFGLSGPGELGQVGAWGLSVATMTPEAALDRLGLVLPTPNAPVGSYMMATQAGSLLFVSGHGAFRDGRPVHLGRLGADVSTAQGAAIAEVVMLNLLATVKAELTDLSRVARWLKVVVFVNSTRDFSEQHLVADGATRLLVRVFGERIGRPARSAVGVAALPLGFAVEIEAVLEVAPE
jgi:enamine deaminase RidA (YjgF/YER057c/UK114 family)